MNVYTIYLLCITMMFALFLDIRPLPDVAYWCAFWAALLLQPLFSKKRPSSGYYLLLRAQHGLFSRLRNTVQTLVYFWTVKNRRLKRSIGKNKTFHTCITYTYPHVPCSVFKAPSTTSFYCIPNSHRAKLTDHWRNKKVLFQSQSLKVFLIDKVWSFLCHPFRSRFIETPNLTIQITGFGYFGILKKR